MLSFLLVSIRQPMGTEYSTHIFLHLCPQSIMSACIDLDVVRFLQKRLLTCICFVCRMVLQQQVSSTPSSREDVINLQMKLDERYGLFRRTLSQLQDCKPTFLVS